MYNIQLYLCYLVRALINSLVCWFWALEPFLGDVGETSERRGAAHMGFSEGIDATLNWTELNSASERFTIENGGRLSSPTEREESQEAGEGHPVRP